jgi:hypothetical protein
MPAAPTPISPPMPSFIIFIAGRIRHGQFPRLPDFPFSEKHGKYIYQGRELNEEEFNAAAAIVFDPHYRNNGFTFQPLVVRETSATEEPQAVEEPAAPVDDVEPPVDEFMTPPDAQPFIIEDGDVFFEGQRVASIQEDGTIRMARGFAPLRVKLDEWLKSQPENES